MSPAELRTAARAQNERDHAAGLLPSRYVEDPGVLARVARLLAEAGADDVPAAARLRKPNRRRAPSRRRTPTPAKRGA